MLARFVSSVTITAGVAKRGDLMGASSKIDGSGCSPVDRSDIQIDIDRNIQIDIDRRKWCVRGHFAVKICARSLKCPDCCSCPDSCKTGETV